MNERNLISQTVRWMSPQTDPTGPHGPTAIVARSGSARLATKPKQRTSRMPRTDRSQIALSAVEKAIGG